MHLILGSQNYLCLHCRESFFYSDSTIDAGFFLIMLGIVLLLLTFAIDTFDIFFDDNSSVGILEMIGYVFSLMIITFGLVFIHLSKWSPFTSLL
jgi:uncharacterized membrane protein